METESESQLYSRRAFLAARKAATVDSRRRKIKIIPTGNAALLLVGGMVALMIIAAVYYGWAAPAEPNLGSTQAAGVAQKKPVNQTEQDDTKRISDSPKLVVYVSGAVKKPQILYLPNGARIADAIEKSGGALPEADLDNLNLAKKLTDGEQIRVNKKGETQRGAGGKNLPSINTAEAAELEKLTGVGPALAKRIVDYRQKHGGFSSLEELQKVPGIGPQKLANLLEQVQL